jgi:hypothetical protein
MQMYQPLPLSYRSIVDWFKKAGYYHYILVRDISPRHSVFAVLYIVTIMCEPRSITRWGGGASEGPTNHCFAKCKTVTTAVQSVNLNITAQELVYQRFKFVFFADHSIE